VDTVDRHETGTIWTRFSENNGVVTAQPFRKVVTRGVSECLIEGGGRIAGKILDLNGRFLAYVLDCIWSPETGTMGHSMVKLGMFPERQAALEAISKKYHWSEPEVRLLRSA
jgi:hypothetical protein